MSFANETRFAALPVPLIDADGNDVLVAIVKATYHVESDGTPVLATSQQPIRLSDETRDPDDPKASLLFPSDVCFAKRGTDVIVVGDAVSPTPVTVMDIAVRARDIMTLRVHGTRVFYEGPRGATIGDAQPFTRMPVAYELAFGGMSDDLSAVELRNPSGVGVAQQDRDLIGRVAPQIEDPALPHTTSADRHPPVGFGAIMTHWSPRRELVGTFDQHWQQTRMPLLPEDYDLRYGNVAHPRLQRDPSLRPGEEIAVVGMSAEPLVSAVPPLPVVVRAFFDTGERADKSPEIDTLMILPEQRLIEVTCRAAFPIGRGHRVLREVVVRGAE